MPLNVKTVLRKASSLVKKGDTGEAERLYRELLEQFPQNRQARSGLAALQGNSADWGTAALIPREHMMRLVELFQSGRTEEALSQGRIAASRYPGDPMLHNFIGAVLARLGQVHEAVSSYQQAVRLKPDYAEVWVNLGVACNTLGQHGESVNCFNQALRSEPGNAQAHCGLGAALKEMGRLNEAAASYSRALELKPDSLDACNNLGNIFERTGRGEEALACYRRAVALAPGNADALCNLGHALSKIRQYSDAIKSYQAALKSDPGLNNVRAELIYLQAMQCDWPAVKSSMENLPGPEVGGEAVSPFCLLAMDDNPGRQLLRAQQYTRQKFQHIQSLGPFPASGQIPQRLRIGYFSADFHDHATMYLMIRLLELHKAEEFEIHAFSFGPDANDGMSARVRQCVAEFHDVSHLGEREIAALARKKNINIAVDLKGYTQAGRPEIFAFRAAPVQVSFLGFPGTSGLPALDYIVADETVIPEQSQAFYSEKVIYMPHSYQVNDGSRPISDKPVSRQNAALPGNGFVFCCFNSSYKISPREFDIWMRLLQRVEGSVLWLMNTHAAAVANLRSEAEARGVAPQRLVFADSLPHAEHLARYRLADLFLDTFNCNAHTTASDALWAGVPVLTSPGESFAARVSASLVRAVGLPELVCSSEAAYEQAALGLALDPGRLSQLRNKLAVNRETFPLFDSELFTRQMETAYKLAFQRYQQGKAPDVIRVANG